MERNLLDFVRAFRPGTGIVLVLAFLVLPYLVDVAYYGDFTPTHYAQETIDDGEDAESYVAKASLLLFAVDQANSGVRVSLPAPLVNTQESHQAGAFLLALSLSESLISRPPPAL